MAHGMLTGDGFANKHKLADYIIGSKTDYFNARKMVNGGDAASYQPIADIAKLFERDASRGKTVTTIGTKLRALIHLTLLSFALLGAAATPAFALAPAAGRVESGHRQGLGAHRLSGRQRCVGDQSALPVGIGLRPRAGDC